MGESQELYFVRVNQVDLLRVSMLESSKLVLHSLQSYYKVLSIRKKKTEKITKLKVEIKELTLLLAKLETMLPHKDLVEKSKNVKPKENPKKHHARANTKNAEKEVVSTTSTTSFSEIDKLNRALSAIEEKLNKLA